MSAGFTPGPWSVQASNSDRRRVIANIAGGPVVAATVPSANDAHLIAAAPDLYEALEAILGPLKVCSLNTNVRDDVCLPVDFTMGELRKARAALSKARGEA